MAIACRCGVAARPFAAVRPGRVPPSRRCVRRRAIDWSDPDTLIGAAGAFAGVALGIGVPLFYISRDTLDEQRLEELRDMNRKHFEETGSYLTDEEIRQIRIPRWTDRREFQDDD